MFDFFLVIDFEATCQEGSVIYPQEIIEFPSVLVDGATGRTLSTFRTYIRPRHHPRLTDFCRELTGIAQEDVDAGVGLSEALEMHDSWLEAHGAKLGKLAVVTWGDWDCRTMLEGECRFKGIEKPCYFDEWINLRLPFSAAFGMGDVRFTLQDAIRKAGLQWEGRLHCGLDDALNTAHLLVELMRRGTILKINGWLALKQSPAHSQQKAALPCVSPRKLVSSLPCQHQVPTPCAAATGMDTVPFCFCGVASKLCVVATPGQMQGHYFYGCGWWTPVCSFFLPAVCTGNGSCPRRSIWTMQRWNWLKYFNNGCSSKFCAHKSSCDGQLYQMMQPHVWLLCSQEEIFTSFCLESSKFCKRGRCHSCKYVKLKAKAGSHSAVLDIFTRFWSESSKFRKRGRCKSCKYVKLKAEGEGRRSQYCV